MYRNEREYHYLPDRYIVFIADTLQLGVSLSLLISLYIYPCCEALQILSQVYETNGLTPVRTAK